MPPKRVFVFFSGETGIAYPWRPRYPAPVLGDHGGSGFFRIKASVRHDATRGELAGQAEFRVWEIAVTHCQEHLSPMENQEVSVHACLPGRRRQALDPATISSHTLSSAKRHRARRPQITLFDRVLQSENLTAA